MMTDADVEKSRAIPAKVGVRIRPSIRRWWYESLDRLCRNPLGLRDVALGLQRRLVFHLFVSHNTDVDIRASRR
jgi:hypothetical protein